MKNRVQLLREMHGMTQEDLALALGVHRQTVLAIERGKFNPSLSLAFRIARYFDIPIGQVFCPGEETGGE